jgi:hypothetical protein
MQLQCHLHVTMLWSDTPACCLAYIPITVLSTRFFSSVCGLPHIRLDRCHPFQGFHADAQSIDIDDVLQSQLRQTHSYGWHV